MRPWLFESGLADILVKVIDVAVDDDARVLPKRQQRIVAEGDPEAPFRPGTKLVPEMNRRPDRGRGDGIAGNDFSLVLHPVDRTDGRGIVGRVDGEGQANSEKNGN